MRKLKLFSLLVLLMTAVTGAWAQAPSGAIDGKFTINADGDLVYFAKGNLQATYDGSAWSWAFATNQWDIIGNEAANTSIDGNGTISGTGTVDLFGWVGENSAFTGTAIYGITNSTTGNQYGNTMSEALKSDRGTLAISNGGNTADFGWRTLTIDEWTYVLNTRTTTSEVRYAKAMVNGIEGLILLPDNWNTTYYSLNSTNTTNAHFDTNVISSDDWTNSLEAHGAVFLPAGGYRSGAAVTITSPNPGFYWSATSSSTNTTQARRLSFQNTGINLASGTLRARGHSVRLVYNAPADPEPEPEPEPQPTTVTWGASEFSSFGVDYLHDSRTVKGITVTVKAATNNFINVTEVGTLFNATIDNAFTFSTELGNITKIECTTIYTSGTLGDGWTIGANSATWEGNTNTLNFGNAGSMLVVSNIIFTIGGGSTPEPEPAEDVNITPNVDPENPTYYYSTFFDSANKYELPAGVEAYVATISEDALLLTKIAEAGQVIPADNAVILKSSVTPFTLTPSEAEAVTFSATNSLQGTDVAIATPADCYVLGGQDGVVGFYQYGGTNLNPHKAYVIYSGSNLAPHRMRFIFDAATGVENVQGNVQSTKVIENGVLYIIKNGVRYNAQGQMVK